MLKYALTAKLIYLCIYNIPVGLFDKLVSNLAVVTAVIVAMVLVLSGFLLLTFAHEIEIFLIVLILAFLSLLFKIPDRYSSIGGTDIGMVSVVMIASTQGLPMGILFAVFVTVVGGRLINEGPQFTVASTFIHIIVAVLSAFLVLEPSNFLFYTMAFVVGGNLIGTPTYIALGNPPHTQLVFSFVNIIWNYAVLSAFGLPVFEVLA